MQRTGQLSFGGGWTADKLSRVREYLCAYTTVLKYQPFRRIYIDAFAGTGYCSIRQEDNTGEGLAFPEFAEPDTQQFIAGSARVALEVAPPFSEYIFIDKDPANCAELGKLREEYPSKRDRIFVENKDANVYIRDICRTKWSGRRAVLFLDPYGMQVSWETIQMIARTRSIDLWYLFPLGVAVNRLVRRNGTIRDAERRRLDYMFGSPDWYDVFYRHSTRLSLFGEESFREKVATFDSIGQYFVERLKTEFVGVAENPLPLFNSTNVPLYLLCFAAGNEKGAPIAVEIAQHILRR